MVKKLVFIIVLTAFILISSETVYIHKPDMINVKSNMQEIITELQAIEIQKLGYQIDSIPENSDYQIKSRIIRFEDERAYYVAQLLQNDKLEFEVSRIITSEDKLDIFTGRIMTALMNRENIEDTKEVGKTITEEETLSDAKEQFESHFSLGLGAHLGTVESTAPDYHYLPVFANLSMYFTKPDYMFSVQTVNVFEGLGLKVGTYRINSRNVNSFFYGGAIGAAVLWGPYTATGTNWNNETYTYTDIDPFFAPVFSASIGGLFNRTSNIVLKPEFELSFMYKKTTSYQIISSAGIYISLVF